MKRLFEAAGILAWRGGRFHYLENAYLAVDGDTISYIGTEKPEGRFDDVKDMTGKLLIPGLINCHCHAAMVLLRGVGSDLPLDRWLFEEMMPVEDRLTREEITAGNELAMMEMLASGVTSFSDMYLEPDTAVAVNEQIGMKMNLCRVVQAFDPEETYDQSWRAVESFRLFDTWHGAQNGRVRIDFGIHAEYTINEKVVTGYTSQAAGYRARGACMQLHLSETQKEHEEGIGRRGMTPAAWFEKVGAFRLPTAAAHCVAVSEEDIGILLRNGVSPIHNPTSNMKLGSGFAPVTEMLEKGLNVALGTDGAASNNNLNMFEEMHLAAIIHNGHRRDPVIMPPETVLRMATVNGAKLQGRADTGRLEVGMKADIVAVDLGRAHMYPFFEPMAMLVYSAQASDVCMTMVDGRILYEDGRYLTLDERKVMADARAAVYRLYEGKRK
ncbi:MAG: amidohydrolase [Clostridia bacterium]|nr:amidohydrolase [Clostridia bacterium]